MRSYKIIQTCQRGFTRVRLTTRTLAWQFWGEPHTALKSLKRFLRRHGIERGVQVTFTDFSTGQEAYVDAQWFFGKTAIEELRRILKSWERSVGRPTRRS